MKHPAVYVLASRKNGTFYVGVTADLARRVWEHKTNAVGGFTKRYGVHTLVYAEEHDDMCAAIAREKQIKNGKERGSWR